MASNDVWDRIFDGPPISQMPTAAFTNGHRRRGRPRPTVTMPQRPDIQGLRALAVVLVILDHIAAWPRGGFVGVDVFFVISGFLITGLLVRAAQKDRHAGHFFGEFYQRRARRILPAALVVLAATWVAAGIAFIGARVTDTHTDIKWAAGFAANIHFADIGTDYFQANRAPSPVQHFWSLAVEEQFYIAWPVVVLLLLAVFARRKQWGLALLLPITALLTLASFVWAIHVTDTNPTAAYFSPFVRAWELGVGATLAVALARWPHLASRLGAVRGPLSLLGVAGVLVSASLITSSSGFPAPAAAAPVLLTALVLFAGSAPGAYPTRWQWPLTNRVATYLGDISYSLYLWHWPIIIFAAVAIPHDSTLRYAADVLITLGVAMISFEYIEEPFRRARFTRRARRTREPADKRPYRGRIAVVAALLVTVGVGADAMQPEPPVRSFQVAADAGEASNGHAATPAWVAQPSAKLAAAIQSALQADQWPTLSPSLDHLGNGSARASWAGCTTGGDAHCTFGPANAPTAVVLGDSIAMAWIPALRNALSGYRLHGFMLVGCPAADVSVLNFSTPPAAYPDCDQQHREMISHALTLKPSLVILADAENTLARIANGDHGSAAAADYQAGLKKTIVALRPSADRKIVTISAPPEGGDLTACDTGSATPADCVYKINATWFAHQQAAHAAATQTGTGYVDTHLFFCAPSDYCPASVGTTPVKFDDAHLTDKYAASLSANLRSALRRIGVQ